MLIFIHFFDNLRECRHQNYHSLNVLLLSVFRQECSKGQTFYLNFPLHCLIPNLN